MKILLPFVFLICLAGCERLTKGDPVPVHDKMPVLSLPDRPVLEKMTPEELSEYIKLPEKTRLKLQSNNEKLMIYADQCVETLKEYNGYARIRNSLSSAWIKGGLKDEPVPPGK